MNEIEATKKQDHIDKLKNSNKNDFNLLQDREILEWSRSDSPVRMYLREMGKIELLTKDEEIVISKTIELGEDSILDAICSVPYLVDFILQYKEPLVNRERKVKELFKNFEDDEESNDTVVNDDEEINEPQDSTTNQKKNKLDKRSQKIIEGFKELEKAKNDWVKFTSKDKEISTDKY